MAKAVGLLEEYVSYRYTSAIHHSDAFGLGTQLSRESGRIERGPARELRTSALIGAAEYFSVAAYTLAELAGIAESVAPMCDGVGRAMAALAEFDGVPLETPREPPEGATGMEAKAPE